MKPEVRSGKKARKKAIGENSSLHQDDNCLTETEVFLSTLIESTDDFIWSVDNKNFGLLSWNRALQDYFIKIRKIKIKIGDRPEELFTNSEYVLIWRKFYQQALKNGNFSGEYKTASGTHSLLLNINPLIKDSKVFGLSVFAKDITSIKKIEESIEKTKDYWQSLVENTSDLVTILDSDAKILYQNSASIKILGKKPKDIIGKNVAEIIHPEDWPHCELVFINHISSSQTKPSKVEFRIQHKNGSWRILEAIGEARLDETGREFAVITSRDITERKHMEHAMRESETLFRSIFDQASVGITQTSIDGIYLEVNERFCELTGYTHEDFQRITYKEITYPDDLTGDNQLFVEMINGERDTYSVEKRYLRKNGELFWANLSVSLVRDNHGIPLYTIGIIQDITDRKQSEEALLQSASELLASQKMARLGSFYLDLRTRIFTTSDVLNDLYGVDKEYDHSIEGWAALIHPDDRERSLAYLLGEVINKGTTADMEFRVVRLRDKSTRVFHAHGNLQYDADRHPIALVGTCQDITELNLTENALREREELFRSAFESAIAGISLVGLGGNFIRVNPKLCEILGYSEDELLRLTFNDITHLEDKEIGIDYLNQFIAGKLESANYEKRYIRKDGNVIWASISVSAIHDNQGRCLYFVTYTQDITERKLASEELHLREERYRSLIETQISLISRCDLKGRFTFVNDAYCKAFGKTREELIGQSFISNVLPEDRDIALKSHKSLFDPPHRYTVVDRSITTAGLRWLHWEGSVVRDNQGNIIELQGVGTDITEQKQNQLELQKSLDQLSKTIEGTIETIALIVEARDPYTAGHQKRVADISVKIAEELGLPEEQIRGIFMAGIIHDVGKIQVPAEILSKPGQLTKLEFDLIKIHPEVGYDLLKGIEFPWPIAQIIYQHHERVDGSGYPRRLKGKDILLEAKIIGIADVIEAMSSHRPYRPALGMDVSLKEIQMNRGTLYDKELVEIYLKVFKNGYRFDEIK